MDSSGMLKLGWTVTNLLVLLGLATGFILIVISAWKQAKAQEKMAAAFREIAVKLDQQGIVNSTSVTNDRGAHLM